MSQSGIALHQKTRNLDGFVGRVVEQLNVELVFGVVQPANGIEQTIDDVLLVIDRQLHRDARQVSVAEQRRRFCRLPLFVLVIKVDHPVAVRAVSRQNDQNDEVGNQQRQVEGINLVEPLKCLVEEMLS